MVSILGSNKGMSFEDRSDDEEEEAHSGISDSSDGVFHNNTGIEGQGEHHVLISSTNDIAQFTDKPNFKIIHTLWLTAFMIVVTMVMLVVSVILAFECDGRGKSSPVNGLATFFALEKHSLCSVRPISLLVYMHCGMWAIFLICHRFIQSQHDKIRRRGYIEFYDEVFTASQLPFWIVSTCSTLLLAISTVLRDHCKIPEDCAKSIHLTRTEYISICIGLESIALLVVTVNYMQQVWRFNRSKVPPDVLRDEMMTCALEFAPNSMGMIEEEIYHRQADLIRYFKERNVILQRTVLQLNSQLRPAPVAIRNNVAL